MTTTRMRVSRVHLEAEDVRVLEFSSMDEKAVAPFDAGSHIDIHLAGGLVRQYSLCNGPQDSDRYIIGVKKEAASRGGSLAMHEQVQLGHVLEIGAPRNNFSLRDTAAHHVLIAGGIGVTPILSMARHLLAANASFELHYFARSPAHTAFHADLSDPRFAGRVEFHYALAPDGVRSKLRNILWERKPNAHLYLCGPRPFMDTVENVASATWPPTAVHLEYFAADANAIAADRKTFMIRLARSGGEYVVPDDMSVVNALAQYGVFVDVSCEQGVCGTCLTGVLEGTPDHRDAYLTDEERGACDKFLPCVSRSNSSVLVLDL